MSSWNQGVQERKAEPLTWARQGLVWSIERHWLPIPVWGGDMGRRVPKHKTGGTHLMRAEH